MPITKIEMEGLFNPPPPENRVLLMLKVHYNNLIYDWQIYAPIDTSDWAQFLEQNKTQIQAQIDKKEQEWAALTPKTKTTINDFGENVSVEIAKDEIVRADVPDYYAKRRMEYPAIGDQLDALWKGGGSPEYTSVLTKIQQVKGKYPKE